jgi:hypothetical protein
MQTGKVAKKSRKARKAKAAAAKAEVAADPQMLAKRGLKYQKAIARHEAQVQELMRKVSDRCQHSPCTPQAVGSLHASFVQSMRRWLSGRRH